MSNPYQTPATETAWTTPGLDLASMAPLRGAILTLRIIVAALVLGVVGFGVYAVAQNAGKPHTLGNLDSLGVVMLVLGVVDGLLGVVVPRVMLQILRSMKPNAQQAAQWAALPPQVARVLAIQNRIQTVTIVGCALFEGAAFANLYAYLVKPELLHLLMAGLMLLGILAQFPLPGACERRIEDELRREKEEVGLR